MNRLLNSPRWVGALTAILAFSLDQASKLLLLKTFGFAHMAPGEAIRVGPFFNLVMVWNRGVSFGLFPADSAAGRYFLIGFSLAVVLALGYWLSKLKNLQAVIGGPRLAMQFDRRLIKGLLPAIGIGLVIGGALGNVLDRLRFGAVADFFHLHAFGYDWYVFNVADAGIVAGVGLLLYESLLGQGQSGAKPGQAPAASGGPAKGTELSDRGRGRPGQG